MLRSDSASTVVLERLESRGHKLAGVAGVFGFEDVSGAASLVEEAIIEKLAGRGTPGPVETSLDGLIKCVEWAGFRSWATCGLPGGYRRGMCLARAADCDRNTKSFQ
jgi:hypothetical protein